MNIYGTTELSFNLEKLIGEESSFLIIVSPYLKLNKRLKAKMSNSFENIDQVLFLYRENNLKTDENDWLVKYPNVNLIPIENLHAKIYINERRSLISSMNLYEYSQINNHEIGIEIEADENREEFLRILEEVSLILSSQEVDYDLQPILDIYLDFSFGSLFYKEMKRYNLIINRTPDHQYLAFCDWARVQASFNEHELYSDKTAILRSTDLGRTKYKTLKSLVSKELLESF